MSGVEVRIRHENDARGKVLGEVNIERLEWLIDELGRWAVSIDDAGDTYGHGQLSAQFRLGRDGAYFDVIVSEEVG